MVGLYRCTEVPGQFVWEPGLLTRAVLGGHWLLIEDIDRASQDVISLLSPLVQECQFNVPSLGGLVRPAPGFQLFSPSVTRDMAALPSGRSWLSW